MDEIEWEDPPAESRATKTATWESTARILRGNPGRWAIVHRTTKADAAREFASRIRQGKVKSFGFGFQAVAADTVVHARYVGDES